MRELYRWHVHTELWRSVKARIPPQPPAEGESFAAILYDVEQIVVPGLSHFQSPRFFGYFPANAELASVLGDYLSTGLGALGITWQAAPALTEVEEVMADWMRQMVGLSNVWSGVIQDTASTSTLVALISGRERASDYSLARGGLQGEEHPFVVYTSEQSHSSVEKDALMAGFGRANVRAIATDEKFALRPELLEAALAEDLRAGRVPTAIVATTGTTPTTALDPIEAIAKLA